MPTFNSSVATVIKVTFNGNAGAGSISTPGLDLGDVVIQILPFGFAEGIETIVSVQNELQQIENLDWSGVTFTAYLLRGV